MVLLPGDFWNSYIEIKLLFTAQLELHNTHWKKKKKKTKGNSSGMKFLLH